MIIVTEVWNPYLHIFSNNFKHEATLEVPIQPHMPVDMSRPNRTMSMMSIVPADDGYLGCGLYEILHFNKKLIVEHSFSEPWMCDLHYVEPTRDGNSMLIVNTGFEECFEMDWTGSHTGIYWSSEHGGYGKTLTPKHADNRGYDHATSDCHVIHLNYAHRLENNNLVLSIFKEGKDSKKGAIVLLDQKGGKKSKITHEELEYTHCPIPDDEGGWWVCSSLRNKLLHLDKKGVLIEQIEDIGFPKCIMPYEGGLLTVDVFRRELVHLNRKDGGWDYHRIPLTFEPYWLCPKQSGPALWQKSS